MVRCVLCGTACDDDDDYYYYYYSLTLVHTGSEPIRQKEADLLQYLDGVSHQIRKAGGILEGHIG